MECIYRVVAEPVAAAFTYFMSLYGNYKLGRGETVTKRILVSDYGGGTYDLSLVEFSIEQMRADGGPPTIFAKVLELDGENDLGGEDNRMKVAVSDLTGFRQ